MAADTKITVAAELVMVLNENKTRRPHILTREQGEHWEIHIK